MCLLGITVHVYELKSKDLDCSMCLLGITVHVYGLKSKDCRIVRDSMLKSRDC